MARTNSRSSHENVAKSTLEAIDDFMIGYDTRKTTRKDIATKTFPTIDSDSTSIHGFIIGNDYDEFQKAVSEKSFSVDQYDRMFFVKEAYKKHRAKFGDLLLRAGSDKSKAEFILHAIEREDTGG